MMAASLETMVATAQSRSRLNRNVRFALVGVIVMAWIGLPAGLSDSLLTLFSLGMVYLLEALGLSLLFGYAGQISLAQAGFAGVGAYTSAYLTTRVGAPVIIASLAGIALPTMIAYVIGRPVLRLRGYYLAMATAAITLIATAVMNNWTAVTNGFTGISGIPPLSLFGFSFDTPRRAFYLASAIVLVTLALTRRLTRSSYGRGLRIIRESEVAAEASGLNVPRLKAEVFAISAALGGLGGVMYAHIVAYVSPDTFAISQSLNLLLIIVVGGLGSMWGAAIGAVVLTVLTQELSGFQTSATLIFGLLVIAAMVFAPEGLYGVGHRAIQWSRRLLGSHMKRRSFERTPETIVGPDE